MPAAQLRIGMAQFNPLVGDIAGNTERVIAQCIRARDELGAHCIVFPELTLCGYPPEDLLLRAEFHRRTEQALARLQAAVTGIHVVLGFALREGEHLYNAAAVIRDGEILGRYHKRELPNYSVFDERRYFSPGLAPCVVTLNGVRAAVTICEDLWHAGAMEKAAEAGAELILNLNASPFHAGKDGERRAILHERQARAPLPVIYVNQVGGQDELVFDGDSFAMDARGEVVQRAPAFVEGLYPVDVVAASEGQGLQLLPGELAPLMAPEASIYAALVLGVRDYIEKNGFQGVVIGLSGGIDSALTLAVAADALGPERVEAILMPSRYTATMSLEDAEAEAQALGVDHRTIPIDPLFQAFLASLAEEFAGTQVDTTEENLQARCRGTLLMAISNKKRRIVLTTGNKSEMAVGYATLYGDMAGGYAVLKDVPKTWVYRLAEYRNGITPVIPQRVIDRPPSAELAADQKDSDSLPPYSELDGILARYVEGEEGPEAIIAAGYAPETVYRVIQMVDRNEYKRRQSPPGVRITRRAFSRDRRYPITSGFGRAWRQGEASAETGPEAGTPNPNHKG